MKRARESSDRARSPVRKAICIEADEVRFGVCGQYIVAVPDLPDAPDIDIGDFMQEPPHAGDLYHARLSMRAWPLIACIRACQRDGGSRQVLAVMAEDYVRGVHRDDSDSEHATAASRAFVDFVVRTLRDRPECAELLRIEWLDVGWCTVSYPSWRRLAAAYGFVL